MNVKTSRASAIGFLLVSSLGTAAAQVSPSTASQQTRPVKDYTVIQPVPAQRNPRYLVRSSDVLQITFPITPEFDQTLTIQPDGFVSLRGVGDMYIENKSVPEVSEALHKVYGQFLHDPIINVELKDFEKPYFIAGGEFGHPGKYELRGDSTVAEAVAIAGGFTDKAKHSEVVLYRHVPGGWSEAKRLDVKQMLAKKDLSEDIHLQPGDLIYVPKNTFSKIREFIPNPGMGLSIPF